ncbi:hypothetical protein [Microbispora corallina]|uniref:hypothetical protein n=1 Tax=Microbispora corallina TaxID=83302 RepID=UPI00194FC97C|nr:hypothetical protein [Microbispora corallina]
MFVEQLTILGVPALLAAFQLLYHARAAPGVCRSVIRVAAIWLIAWSVLGFALMATSAIQPTGLDSLPVAICSSLYLGSGVTALVSLVRNRDSDDAVAK